MTFTGRMAYRNSMWNSIAKKVFYLFFGGVLSIPWSASASASEVIEVAGSNHAIGVILNLAWGPNNFSPSMIWSWRTRSNSQTGLGAEYLLPLEFAFCFCCLFYFPLIIITLCLVLFPFSYYCWALIILGHCDIYRSWLWYVSVAFFSLFYLKLGAISFSVYVIIIIIIITK